MLFRSYKKVQCSAGFCHGTPESEEDVRLMVATADHNLYKAKNSGKGCHVGSPFQREAAKAISASDHSHHFILGNESDGSAN